MRTKQPLLADVVHARVDEVIWGHRLREDQSGKLLVLELLNVAQLCLQETGDPLLDVGVPGSPVRRGAPLRVRFRNLLFRFNQKAAELAARVERGEIKDEAAWGEWLTEVGEQYDAKGGVDWAPLKARFESFVEFERSIDLVRSTSIENPEAGKDVYNHYLFPLCSEALYWEVTSKDSGTLDPTYNSFTRAGTLAHIMLARSHSAERLRPLLGRFLTRNSPARRLVTQLQVEEQDDFAMPPKTYLPYAAHPRFNYLADDLIRILELDVPENDKFLWLVPLTALHLSLYHMEAAHEHLSEWGHLPHDAGPIPIICEIVAPRKNIVRELSIESLKGNRDLARRAVEAFLVNVFDTPDWKEAEKLHLSGQAASAVNSGKSFIERTLRPTKGELEEAASLGSLEKMREHIVAWFIQRHKREFSDVHFQYGREGGLVALRGTNRYRYAPTDQLLKALVLANVEKCVPLEQFLDCLFRSYGIVVGTAQQRVISELGQGNLAKQVAGEGFRNNQARLEVRLKSMGMLRRLSDSQAYVINPLQ